MKKDINTLNTNFALELMKQERRNILAYPYNNIPRDKIEDYFEDKIKKLEVRLKELKKGEKN